MAALATEVNTTPQALVKHLKILENHGIIEQYTPNTEDEKSESKLYSVRAGSKDDKKIKYYTLAKNVNLRINFGLGIGLEIQGQIWKTDDFKKAREDTKQKYQEILDQFINMEKYIKNQLNDSFSPSDHLKTMNELLEKFDDMERFLLIQRQLIMIKKLKSAIGFLADEKCIELRPMFFELLQSIDIDKTKMSLFKEKLNELLPGKVEDTIKLLKDVKASTIEVND